MESFMESNDKHYNPALPFPVPNYRFNQRNEMFKRNVWDEKNRSLLKNFNEVKYQSKAGYQKMDYAFRNASWSLEWRYGMGNSRSNFGLYEWEGVPEKIKPYVETGGQVAESPEEMTRMIKKVARFYGASLVGICRVHPNWIYFHEFNVLTQETYPIEVPEGCNHAVVMAIEMDYGAIRSSPTGVSSGATGLGYSKMAFVANMVANFIRGLGYRAIPAGNDTALSVPLAMAAGLGEGSRMGLLMTEAFGPRIRLCKVFTDLPVQVDSYRPFGVTKFCKTCKKCAIHCPSQAIPHGEMTTEGPNISNHSGVLKWYVDGEKCYTFWARNRMDCANCIRVCPFNKAPGIVHEAVRLLIKKTTLFNPLFDWMDNLLGYDRPISAKKFWGSE
ncbi:MAG: reductive dehalogenase [Deltaproteobacteria bacterium]|nr:reductive dehalogenase [Deltaproteobacteria bacterium]